eukprot:5379643-Prymnesium_polylepis.1
MEFFTTHTDYERLAIRLLIDNMHRNVNQTFTQCMEYLYSCNRLSEEFMEYVRCLPELNEIVDREIPDRFMRAVSNNETWHLFSPDDAPGLSDVFGKEYDDLYDRYVSKGKFRKKIMAQELWNKVFTNQIETGTPYMTYKDSANVHSNQSNIGVIKSSNLCTEIMEVSTPEETAVCNLASICVSQFDLKPYDGDMHACFDFRALQHTTRIVVKALNKVIDNTLYPHEKTRISNIRHRPSASVFRGGKRFFSN